MHIPHACTLNDKLACFVSRGIACKLSISPMELTFGLFLSAHKFGARECYKHLRLPANLVAWNTLYCNGAVTTETQT